MPAWTLGCCIVSFIPIVTELLLCANVFLGTRTASVIKANRTPVLVRLLYQGELSAKQGEDSVCWKGHSAPGTPAGPGYLLLLLGGTQSNRGIGALVWILHSPNHVVGMDLDKCCSDGSSTIFIPLMVSTGGERMVMLKTQVSPGPLNSGLNSSCVDSVSDPDYVGAVIFQNEFCFLTFTLVNISPMHKSVCKYACMIQHFFHNTHQKYQHPGICFSSRTKWWWGAQVHLFILWSPWTLDSCVFFVGILESPRQQGPPGHV